MARIGKEQTEAFVQLPAFDLPHLDAGEPLPGVLTLTLGYQTGRGYVGQVTYDSQARAWRDYRPLLEFPDAQTVEVADVGAAGVLAVLGLPWNIAEDDPETGLYWIRRGEPVRHLLQRIRELRAVALPDGFVALFSDEFTRDEASKNRSALFVLRAQRDRLALYRLPGDELCSPSHFVWLGENRFLATFCSNQALAFEVPEVPSK